MKEKPILFSGPMVRAILDGRKTQTRRVIKDINEIHVTTDSGFQYYSTWRGKKTSDIGEEEFLKMCPYGEPGTALWVRETFWRGYTFGGGHSIIGYKSDGECRFKENVSEVCNYASIPDNAKFVPSIHMPRWASRINLLVKNVRVERLQDISEEDAVAEGLQSTAIVDEFGDDYIGLYAVEHFQDLWNSINEKLGYGWDTNPWVWVVEFERV